MGLSETPASIFKAIRILCFIVLASGNLFAQTPIQGSVHPNVRLATDLGQVSGSTPLPSLQVSIRPSAEQQVELDKLTADQRNPASSRYHQWLSAKQFGAKFGISQADEARVRTWLAAQGFSNVHLTTSRRSFSFSGNAGQAQKAFGTPIHSLVLHGERHIANIADAKVPNELSSLIQNVRGLNDFRLKSHAHQIKPQYTDAGGGIVHLIAPGDLAAIYDIQSLHAAGIDGTGLQIAIVGQSDVNLDSIAEYRSDFGLPPSVPTVTTYLSDPGINGDEIEGELDIELAGAVAPGAQIVYIASPDVYNALLDAIEEDLAPVISMSYGGCENTIFTSNEMDTQFATEQAAAEGITLIVASGDMGATDCEWQSLPLGGAVNGLSVDEPSNQPGFTAVGGTSFVTHGGSYFSDTNGSTGGSALSYIPEKVWNDTYVSPYGNGIEASGGGASLLFSKPAWQEGPGVPADGQRDIPDLAMFSMNNGSADDEQIAYLVCTQDMCASGLNPADAWGGTSASAPVFAGIVTLLNQYLVSDGQLSQPGLGNINPHLYLLAQHSSDVFHDITVGNNNTPCVLGTPTADPVCTVDTGNGLGSIGFSAGPGYDQASGLGSIDAYNFVHEWTSVSTVSTSTVLSSSPSPILTSTGIPLTLTAAVTATDNSVPTGTVTFYAYFGGIPDGMFNNMLLTLGTAQLGGTGIATLTLPAGMPYQIVRVYATYPGTANYAESFSNDLSSHTPGGVYLTSSSQQINQGDSITISAFVLAYAPSGTLTLYAGSTPIGTVPLTVSPNNSYFWNGTLTVSNLPAGQDSITGQYSGDLMYEPWTSAPVVITVTVPTTTTVSATPNQAVFGAAVTLTATVAPTSGSTVPTGTVTFFNGATSIGTASLTNGTGSIQLSTLPVGTDSITAQYAGATYWAASTSSPALVTISAITTTTTVTATPNQGAYGSTVTLTATVAPTSGSTAPTGTVTFFNGAAPIGTANLTNGTGSISLSTLPVGTDPITAQYAGATNFAASTSSAAPVAISAITTTTTVTATPNQAVFGSAVTLTATVAPASGSTAPTGTVTFFNGATPIGTTSLTNGTGSIQLSTLPVGTDPITAAYGGATNFAASTSSAAPVAISAIATTTTVSATPNQAVFGSAVTLTATVAPTSGSTAPTGTVTFFNGATPIGTTSLTNGTGSLSLSTLPVGTDSITAQYAGATNFAASTSSAAPVAISAIATTTTVSATPNQGAYGSTVTLTATVAPASGSTAPTGTVTFFNGAAQIGTTSLTNGTGSLSLSTLPVGTDPITAQYAGATNFAASTSSAAPVAISAIATTTTVSATPNQGVYGSTVTLTATVVPASGSTAPTGTVTFFNGAAQIGTASLTNGTGSISLSTLPMGADSITAQYAGAANFAASTSSAVPVTILIGTTTTVLATPNQAAFGSAVTLTATVAPASGSTAPTGTVTFLNGATPIGTANLTNGTGSLSLSTLPVGTDSITAQYAGAANFAASTSSAVPVTILIGTTTTVLATPNQAAFGSAVTLTATVAPASGSTAPTGTVTFFNGTTQIGTANLTNGTGSLSLSTLPVGTDSITAQYAGATNFAASTSSAVPVTISAITTTTTVSATPNQGAYGSTVTLTATVAPASGSTAPAGTVTFLNGATPIGTASLTNGTGSLSLSTLPVGTDSITAQYAGAANFAASTSSAVPVTIVTIGTTTTVLATPNQAAFGSAVTLTATVAPASGSTAPTGTVTFLNGTAQIGTAILTNGTGSLSLSTLPVGVEGSGHRPKAGLPGFGQLPVIQPEQSVFHIAPGAMIVGRIERSRRNPMQHATCQRGRIHHPRGECRVRM